MRRVQRLFLALFLIINLATACSTQKTVTTRYSQYDPRTGEPVTIEKETTTTEQSGAGAAVLSGAASVIGTVILLPVRAVGILIDAIL
jgi:hypothetical protein